MIFEKDLEVGTLKLFIYFSNLLFHLFTGEGKICDADMWVRYVICMSHTAETRMIQTCG